MDFGIAGKHALVCASSSGLGKACAISLSLEGAEVWINGRDAGRLEAAAVEIDTLTGRRPHTVLADVDTAEGRATVLAACPAPDILVCNSGGPKPGRLEDWTETAWSEIVAAKMISPILLIQSMIGGMRERGFGRVVAITSAMVKTPKFPMALSTGPRAGLTAFCKALAGEVASDGVTVNCILPEKVETDRLAQMTRSLARVRKIDEVNARAEMVSSIPAGRFGRPSEVGDACAFLCSDRAGYITGQNLQLDGGAYSGLI
ncbi:SDR family oxidoreductase [Brevundimonas sp. UBA2416]|uniref:SDR family oxidoreductase n=1 Tax=Brevundimonas sp. UBA2416 TaxID=1946124 RepID=UPI0025BBFF77|nr:SDR family oxidoreductase [Brevundimonas sp. UBA2416]